MTYKVEIVLVEHKKTDLILVTKRGFENTHDCLGWIKMMKKITKFSKVVDLSLE